MFQPISKVLYYFRIEALLGQCVKFVPEKSDFHGKQDSSSGVESGSSNSGSGTNSPILFSDQYAPEPNGLAEKDIPNPVQVTNPHRHDSKGFSKIKVLGQSINVFSRDSSVSHCYSFHLNNPNVQRKYKL
jgi:hypothetical protein